MTFFFLFSILIASMIVFSLCGFRELATVRVRRLEMGSLVVMSVSFLAIIMDTFARSIISFG